MAAGANVEACNQEPVSMVFLNRTLLVGMVSLFWFFKPLTLLAVHTGNPGLTST